jgi:hypothetical protein
MHRSLVGGPAGVTQEAVLTGRIWRPKSSMMSSSIVKVPTNSRRRAVFEVPTSGWGREGIEKGRLVRLEHH